MFDCYDENLSFNGDISPEQFIELMFFKTTDNGIVFIPGGFDDTSFYMDSFSWRCKVDWSYADIEIMKEEFASLNTALERIAEHYEVLDGTEENARKTLDDKKLFEIWSTYIKPFDIEGFDITQIEDIKDRLDTVKMIKELSGKLSDGNNIGDEEKMFIKEYIDIDVSNREKELFDRYIARIYEECEDRVGDSICAFELIVRVRRVLKLMLLAAPDRILNFEKCMLTAMLVMHSYGRTIEKAEDSTRFYFEQFDTDDDEILDMLYKPKKQNKVKSLAPLYIFFIIKNHSNSSKHLRYKDIMQHLENDYGIILERKAVGRTVHSLADSGLGIYTDSLSGVWAEE